MAVRSCFLLMMDTTRRLASLAFHTINNRVNWFSLNQAIIFSKWVNERFDELILIARNLRKQQDNTAAAAVTGCRSEDCPPCLTQAHRQTSCQEVGDQWRYLSYIFIPALQTLQVGAPFAFQRKAAIYPSISVVWYIYIQDPTALVVS